MASALQWQVQFLGFMPPIHNLQDMTKPITRAVEEFWVREMQSFIWEQPERRLQKKLKQQELSMYEREIETLERMLDSAGGWESEEHPFALE
ncbi:MAG: hypothetical protein M4579_001565 [Chaenotheca gracillima]|nr:MAG: hypothetical protein M4579_001565 [Chaenotheca gracillima]